MDEDLDAMSREALIAEVRKLRAGVRAHRDSTGPDAPRSDAHYDTSQNPRPGRR